MGGPPSHSKMLEISDYKEDENTLGVDSSIQRDTEISMVLKGNLNKSIRQEKVTRNTKKSASSSGSLER